MKKYYTEPELEIRKYSFADAITTVSNVEADGDGTDSDNDFFDGDDYDPFG